MEIKEAILESLDPKMAELREQINEKKKELKEFNKRDYTEDDYDDMLDDCYEEITIFGSSYTPSELLKKMDRVKYDIGMTEEEDYKRGGLEDEIKELEKKMEELKK